MDIFSNLQVIGECLLDKKRVQAFEKAINNVVKRGDVVVDAGTGSGILALMSARAGAKKVYGIEIAEDVAEFARKNVAANGFNDKVEIILSDVKNFNLGNSVDVVTAELLDTCLVAEHQAYAINHLRATGVIDDHTQLIPYKIDCALQLVDYDFDFYGFDMPFVVQARNYGATEHVTKYLSNVTIFKRVDLRKKINTTVDTKVKVKIKNSGVMNAVLLKSRTHLDKNIKVWGTSDMNMPVVIPLEPLNVKAGEIVEFIIKYKMSEGFGNLLVKVT